jgi:nickel/cobalt transporter (NiCoT) family protein
MAASGTLRGSDAVGGPTSRISKIRDGLTPREWAKVGLMAATVLGLNIAGWGMLALALRGHYHVNKTEFFGFGTGVLAYTLGMRHAFDADHIAAIDNTTRKLIQDGQRPLSVGYFFSLGHSTIVFVLAVLLNFGIRALNGAVKNNTSALHHWTGIIGTSISGTFLYLIGLLNLVVLFSIIKVSRQMRRGRYDDAELERQLDSRGLMNRVLGGYAKRVDSPWKMYPVGVLFGLGFDTATEVALLVLAGSAVVGGLPFYAVISLPILFAAGMCLFDTIDGCFMNFAYGWAFSRPIRKIYYNLTITSLSVFIALFIGTVEILGLIAQETNRSGGFWDVLAKFNINRAGFIIVGVFVATWIVALAIWHFGDIEHKWETQAAQAYTDVGASPHD